MAEQVPVVGNVLSLIERRDWSALERFLAPDVHWTTAVDEQLHGPAEVIECLRSDPVPWPVLQENRAVDREEYWAWLEEETGLELTAFLEDWLLGRRTPDRRDQR